MTWFRSIVYDSSAGNITLKMLLVVGLLVGNVALLKGNAFSIWTATRIVAAMPC